MLTGLNLTLAVCELEWSIGFHRGIPGFELAAQPGTGACLELGDLRYTPGEASFVSPPVLSK